MENIEKYIEDMSSKKINKNEYLILEKNSKQNIFKRITKKNSWKFLVPVSLAFFVLLIALTVIFRPSFLFTPVKQPQNSTVASDNQDIDNTLQELDGHLTDLSKYSEELNNSQSDLENIKNSY